MSESYPPPLSRRAAPRDLQSGFAPHTFPRYVRRCTERQEWDGPVYVLTSQWQSDLIAVMEQIRLCVASNVPLGTGFEAIARDRLGLYRDWSPQRAARSFKFSAISFLVVSAALSCLFVLPAGEWRFWVGLAKIVLLSTWCYFSVFVCYLKPMAVFVRLKRHIDHGCTLSEAMARLPRFFPRNLVCLVEAGERTGSLHEILDQFNEDTIRAAGMQFEFDRTLRYLGANALVIVILVVITLWQSTAVLADLTEELGIEPTATVPGIFVPVPTLHTINAATSFLIQAWYIPLGALFLVLLASWHWWRRSRGHWPGGALGGLLLGVPVLRGMIVANNLGGAARMLHHLLRGGVPLQQAMEMVERSDLHPWYQRWFRHIRLALAQGATLDEACAKHANPALVPRSFRAILAMGEGHGNLVDALDWIGSRYHEKFEWRYRFLLGCVLPAGIVTLGYLVLTIEATAFHILTVLADALIV